MDLQRRGTGIQASDPGQPIKAPIVQITQGITGSGPSRTRGSVVSRLVFSQPTLAAVNVGQRCNRSDDSPEGFPRLRRPYSRVPHTSIMNRGYDIITPCSTPPRKSSQNLFLKGSPVSEQFGLAGLKCTFAPDGANEDTAPVPANGVWLHYFVGGPS